MADKDISIDASQLDAAKRAFFGSPFQLIKETCLGFSLIGKSDILKLRKEQLSGGGGRLNVRFRGARNAFKSRASNPNQVKKVEEIRLSEYTGWKAARIFETGGEIRARGKWLTVMTDAAKAATGRRKFSPEQLRAMIDSGQAFVMPTRKGYIIARSVGGYGKSGKMRKGSRTELLGVLRRQVTVKKRLDFYGNFDRNAGEHVRILDAVAERTVNEIGKEIDKEKAKLGRK